MGELESDRGLNGCERCLHIQHEVKQICQMNNEALASLITILNGNVRELLNLVGGKKQVPLDVLKWIVVFLLIFCFSVFFGVAEVKQFIKFWS